MKILNVGCGLEDREENVIYLDLSADAKPDVVWNLDEGPYPFEDNYFDEIRARDVVEHLQDITFFLKEIYRVLKPGGKLIMHTPHFSCADSYTDPTHRFHLSYYSFDFFTPEHIRNYYSACKFKINQRHIHFKGDGIFIKCLEKYANKKTYFYEQRLAWIFPAGWLSFELEAVK